MFHLRQKGEESRLAAAQVRQAIQKDALIRSSLSLGIVNQRALARFLIKSRAIPASESAVLSAIRRTDVGQDASPFERAQRSVRKTYLHLRSHACQIVAAKSASVQEKVSAIFQRTEFAKGEILYLSQGEAGLKIIVDESKLPFVRSILGKDLTSVTTGLAALVVVWPPTALETPGVLALFVDALAYEGINVVDTVFGNPEFIFFVAQEDALSAYHALEAAVLRSK